MANETQTTAPAQPTEPDWQKKADELSKRIDGNLFVQLAYRSDPLHSCEPVLLSEKQTQDIYPIVVEVPTGMINPKFNWHSSKWEETDSAAMATQLNNLTTKVNQIEANGGSADLKKQVSDMQKQVTTDQQSTQKQLAQLLVMVSSLMAKPTSTQSAASAKTGGNQ